MTETLGKSAGLLHGLKVLDLTRGMAGAVAGMLLADCGADVVKVEPPGGDPFRYLPPNRVWDRNKRSVTLDLASDSGRGDFLGLAAKADLLLESLTPRSARKLGIDRMGEHFPHLVQVSIGSYGEDHALADAPGYEHLVDAWLGVTGVQLGRRPGPKFNAYPVGCYGAAFLAVTGALAALHAKAALGRGQRVSTSLLDGAFFLNTMQWHWHEKGVKIRPPGADPALQRRHLLDMGVLECADGGLLIIHTGVAGRFAEALEVMGIGGAVTPAAPEVEKVAPLTPEEKAFLEKRIPEIIRTRPRAEWLQTFEAADVCCMPVDMPGAVFDDPQTVFDQCIATLDDPVLGRVRMLGPVLKCEQAPARIRHPAPGVGGDTAAAVLTEWSGPAGRIPAVARQTPRQDQAPPRHALQGLRIVDFGNFYAGPGASRILSDLGADVIKVEPPGGDLFRATASSFPAANRGKRSIALDLKTPDGRRIAHQLVARADAVTHNMRPGATQKLGLDFETIRQVNPRIIYLYSPGFGSAGPRAGQTAFAPLLSGMAGVSAQSAGLGNRPLATWISNEDQVGGCLGAVWLLMGLYYRERTGMAVRLESSLFSAALFCASEVLTRENGEPVFRFEVDRDLLGYGPLARLYRTGDGWIMLAAPLDGHFDALKRLVGPALSGTHFQTRAERTAHSAELGAVLEQWFASRSAGDAHGALAGAGVPSQIAREPQIEQWLHDDANLKTGRVHECVDPVYGRMRTQGHAVRFSVTPGLIRGGPPGIGQHTRDILEELGYSSVEIEDLATRKIIRRAETASA
jgi:crotonobetainyl-CoA:carnitine CoA-transferase CaiB-like acyl-CoA transferase